MHLPRVFAALLLLLAVSLRSQAATIIYTSTLTVTEIPGPPAASDIISLGDQYLLTLAIDDSVFDSDPSISAAYFSDALVGASLSRIPSNDGSWDPAGLSLTLPASIDLDQISEDTAELDLTYQMSGSPGLGTVVMDQDGTWRYTPTSEARQAAADTTSTDSFTVTVSDVDYPFQARFLGTPLTVIPEPSAITLLVLGSLALSGALRRRRKLRKAK